MVLILFMAMIAGCFADDDTATVALSSSQTLEIEGNLPNLNAPVLNSTADHAAGIGNSDKYSFSVIDKDTNVEIGTVTANGNSFKATIGILNTNLCPVINVKESKSGRIIYSALFGKIPSVRELPAAVKTLKISGISIDAMTTARALIALENKISITETLFTVSTAEVQAGTFIKNYNGQKTAIDNHLETKVIGSDNVNEFAKAVTAIATILTSPNISDNVKNAIAPSITNATQLLTSFVKLAKANDGVLKAVMMANHTASEISLSKIRICSDTDDQTMATIIAKLNVIEKVDNPSFTPDAGTYAQPQNITITCPTAGAIIYYTLDGITPTASSALYTGALSVSATSTIKVIAIKPGMLDSDVVTAAYTINIPVQQAATPIFSIATGTYAATQSVEITCPTAGAAIYYTIDGTNPTVTSALYKGSITLNSTTTLKAVAIKPGMLDSDVVTAAYTINIPTQQVVATPVFSIASGTYTSTQSVEISCATSGATIYYTLNGSNPTTSSTTYTNAISISTSATIKAIAVKSGMTNSDIASANYTINIPLPKVSTPTFNIADGTYTETQSVEISCTTAGSKIYYTLDRTAPTSSSTLYSGTISVSITTTIKAIAIKTGMADSDLATASYTINLPLPKVTTPIFNISNGSYTETQSVEITCATPNAKIYYTLDGTAPTSSSSLYSGTLSVSITSTIKAIAIKTGMADSDLAMANYTINIPALQVAKPVFSVPAGAYTTAQTLTITCATPGATIYYSTNGSDPSNSLLIYTASITIAADMTLKAIAKKAGYIDSPIESVNYKVSAPTTPFTLSSTELTNLGALPSKYAKANTNVSPAFTWGTPPAGTKSLMLVCVDDNGTPTNSMDDFIQWGIYNIPPTATGLAEGIAKGATVTSGVLPSGSAAQAINDYGNTGYDGPDPAAGAARTYVFQLYALNVEPNIPAGANKATILPIIISNVIAGTNLTVFYQK